MLPTKPLEVKAEPTYSLPDEDAVLDYVKTKTKPKELWVKFFEHPESLFEKVNQQIEAELESQFTVKEEEIEESKEPITPDTKP